jgi:Reeler domain
MISIYFRLVVAVAAILALPFADGNSVGASNCVAGGGAIAGAGVAHSWGGTTGKTGENGALSKRGTTFAINGVNVKGGESYTVGSVLKFTLKTTDVTYGMRGILIRVSTTGGDSFTLSSTQLKDNTYCTGVGVSGLTHKDATVKKSVTGTFRFDKAGSVTVDVTVVYRNGGVKPKLVSINGYSQYKFTIKAKA